ncbi:MAG: host-nuclease inhibitor Gam family protein [Melioribacteraceae bacterium]|nr:host-nuclease inhibitor Gam family protein [Melioribacteraceae bacterium]
MKPVNQPVLNSVEDVNDVLLNIAVLTNLAQTKENKLQKKIIEITKIHEPDIKELKEKILHYENQIHEFCKRNKKEFASTRSKKLTYGTIGFRFGKSSLKLVNTKKFTWEYAKEKFSNLFATKYITIETSLNKQKILSDADKGLLTADQLEAAGCKVSKSEKSYYEINWTEIKIEQKD